MRTLIATLTAAKASDHVWQAAAWIVNIDRDYAYLTSVGGSRPMLSDDDIVAALRLSQASGVDVTGKAIWPHRPRFLANLKDDSNRQWLGTLLSADVSNDPAKASARIESYEPSITTLDNFLADRWNTTDAVSGRTGIVAFSGTVSHAEYIMGTCGMLADVRNQERQDADRRHFGFAYFWPGGVNANCQKVWHLKFENSVLQSRTRITP